MLLAQDRIWLISYPCMCIQILSVIFWRIELGINQFYYEPIFVEVYDLSGRQLRSETFEFSADGIPRHSVDMSDVPLGVYILNVRTGTIARSILVTKNSR